MATIPVWLTPSTGTYTVVITPHTVTTAGVLTSVASATASLTADVSDLSIELSTRLVEISALTASRENNVQIKNSCRISISEILKNTGSNKLASIASLYTYFLVVITRGAQSFSFYGIFEGYSENLGEPPNTGTLTLAMIDPGAVNPTYA